jgi:hypothetical protein
MRIGNMMQIVFFIGFLFTGSTFTLFVHMTTASSETENRRLASFPICSLRTMISGVFFRQFENYAADHIGFRDSLVHTSKFITSLQGMAGSESALIVPSNANNTAEAQSAPPVQNTPNTTQTTQLAEQPLVSQQVAPNLKPPLPEEKGKIQGKVLILGDRAMNLFSFDAAAGQAYADVINHIQARLDQIIPKQVQASVLLAPTAVEFIQSAKLKSLSDSQKKAIDEVYWKIRTDVTKVDALSSMSRHAREPLFFRTDHHWTATGAYYAYAAFIEVKGMKPVPITAYQTGEVPEFLGSLYSSTMNRQLAAHPDTIVYYKPNVIHQYTVHYSGSMIMPLIDLSHAKKKNKYRIFLSGDRPWAQITTQIKNNRRLMVIKDSYGNALVPFLLPHYSEIFVVDPRQFDEPLVPFIQKHNIQEILYVNNAGVTMDQGFAEQLRKLAPD